MNELRWTWYDFSKEPDRWEYELREGAKLLGGIIFRDHRFHTYVCDPNETGLRYLLTDNKPFDALERAVREVSVMAHEVWKQGRLPSEVGEKLVFDALFLSQIRPDRENLEFEVFL